MDTTLVTVTVLSMSMAAALSAIVWRMLRLERHRSNARVAALRALAAGASAKTAARDDPDLPLRHSAPVTTSAMFVERERSSPWGARVGVMAGLALVVASVVLLSLAARAQKTVPPAAAQSAALKDGAAAAATVTGASPAGASAKAGLELLSLRDSRQSGSLTITGLVQNPRTGTPLSRVTVTAYTFDDTGSFLASARALIDVTSLAPGDESPFVVNVPVTDTVARYRIGFRDDAGRVIAHVDRRQQGPIAANW